jgi:hypothetical protein
MSSSRNMLKKGPQIPNTNMTQGSSLENGLVTSSLSLSCSCWCSAAAATTAIGAEINRTCGPAWQTPLILAHCVAKFIITKVHFRSVRFVFLGHGLVFPLWYIYAYRRMAVCGVQTPRTCETYGMGGTVRDQQTAPSSVLPHTGLLSTRLALQSIFFSRAVCVISSCFVRHGRIRRLRLVQLLCCLGHPPRC